MNLLLKSISEYLVCYLICLCYWFVSQNYYPILFRGVNGTVAHEFIVDLRGVKVVVITCLFHSY
jgi:hypothetical protein